MKQYDKKNKSGETEGAMDIQGKKKKRAAKSGLNWQEQSISSGTI